MSARSSRASVAALLLASGLAAFGGSACSKSAPPGSGAGDGTGDGTRRGHPLRVAAAADLALAFKDVGADFEKATGKKVEFSFGSTGLLAKQIAEGAPFDVFAAANIAFVDDVVKAGACDAATKHLYAKGRIVVWAKDASLLPGAVRDLENPRWAKISIANPEHAPYGQAAQQALTRAGVWPVVERRTVHGENVQQALVYARTGNSDAAIVALSLAVTSDGAYLPIDPSMHEPLDQAMVACNGGVRGTKSNEARAFIEFVGSEAGRATMKRYGFLLPGEALPAK